MTAAVSASQAYAFSDAGSGKDLVFPGGAPAVDQWDVLLCNSDGLINVPAAAGASFTTAVSQVSSQAAYIFVRQATGGETDTVTVTTPQGNVPAELVWCRVVNADAVNIGDGVRQDSSPGTSTPALLTVPAVGELGLALAGLHNQIDGAAPTGITWTTGWTEVTNASQGSGGTAVFGTVAVNDPTDDPQPQASVTWTNRMNDRYLLLVSFTPAAITVVDGDLDAGLPPLAAASTAVASLGAALAATLPPMAAVAQAVAQATATIAVTLPALAAAVDAGVPASGTLTAGLPAMVVDVGGFLLAGDTLPALTGTASTRGLDGAATVRQLAGTARLT